jgi:hypothetical protein
VASLIIGVITSFTSVFRSAIEFDLLLPVR